MGSMTLRELIKKALSERFPGLRTVAVKNVRVIPAKPVKLESLKISRPRTTAEIKQAYKGRALC